MSVRLSRILPLLAVFTLLLGATLAARAASPSCTLNGKPVEFYCFQYDKCPAESGRVICKNEKDAISGEWEVQQGKPVGYQSTYFDDGSKVEKIVDEKGKFNGYWKKFDPSGRLIEEDQYIHGQYDGRSATYYASGKLKQLSWWKIGMRTFAVDYDEDGRIGSIYCSAKSEAPEAVGLCGLDGKAANVTIYNRYWIIRATYLNGEAVSKSRYDTKTGAMTSSESNSADDSATKKYYPNGKLSWEGSYKNGRLDGVEREYHESGKLTRQTTWQYGEELESTEYYLNGQKSYDETRKKQDGNKWLTAIKTYYDNGKLESEFALLDGDYVGEDRGYNEKGNLVYVGTYNDKGKITHEKFWDNNGKLVSDEELFEDGSRKSVMAGAQK
ncbi:MAG: toxin-antitoxin system YwqK family antitoxin [Terracidiphilus sp.]|jgi:antitoxin component YwqK of YwqJK toxin-antitoxin module